MPTHRDYRDHLYRNREHPEDLTLPSGFTDGRDSFFSVYVSFLPFLGLEYYAELKMDVLPSGLVFPVGFVIFWSFYYTFYKPNYLEGRLSAREEWDAASVPALVLGAIFWSAKTVLFSAAKAVVGKLWAAPKRPGPSVMGRPDARPRPREQERPRPQAQARPAEPAPAPQPPPPSAPPPLPREVQDALAALGLPQCREWGTIHARYKELVKRYHPDVNPEHTATKFMHYDAAYRRLYEVRQRYFRP